MVTAMMTTMMIDIINDAHCDVRCFDSSCNRLLVCLYNLDSKKPF